MTQSIHEVGDTLADTINRMHSLLSKRFDCDFAYKILGNGNLLAASNLISGHVTPKGGSEVGGDEGQAKRVFLVYQAGIANVFEVECFSLAPGGKRERLLQHAFSPCEYFARGMGAAGAIVRTAACNMAGDIAGQIWSEDLDAQPFSDKFHPVKIN